MGHSPQSACALVYFARPTSASRKWLAAAGRIVRRGSVSGSCRDTRLEPAGGGFGVIGSALHGYLVDESVNGYGSLGL